MPETSSSSSPRARAAEPLGIIERAYALARSGECSDVDEIRNRLKQEQYSAVERHLSGSLIRKQLRELIAKR
jgi:hypothetical protein